MVLYPVHLYDSGISGLSMLLDRVTPDFLSLSLFLIIINIPIFIFGFKKHGIAFTIYSVFAVLVYSASAYAILNNLPIDNISFSSPIAGTDLLLCAIFGGTLSGIGSGLTIRFGGALDGIDILSLTFAKIIGISVGTFTLVFNIVLYVIAGIIFSSWVLPLYSIIAFFVGSKVVDFIVEGVDRSKCAMIITSKSSEISKELSQQFKSTGTIVKAIGGYSKDEKEIIYFVVNRFQINKIKTIVHTIDDQAYITIQDVTDIIKKPIK